MASLQSSGPPSSIDRMPSRLDSVELPTIVKVFRPLIVRCLKYNEIIHYLDSRVIDTRTREEIIQTGNREGSTVAMDDILIAMEASDDQNKWEKFINIVEEQGYQYLAKVLRGEYVPSKVYTTYVKLLQRKKMAFAKASLDPSRILSLLSGHDVLENIDCEHIQAEQNNKGALAATIVLLDRIWRKHEDWYRLFLTVLCEKKYHHIVEDIDHAFYEDWEKSKHQRQSSEEAVHKETPDQQNKSETIYKEHPNHQEGKEPELSKPIQVSEVHEKYPGPNVAIGSERCIPFYDVDEEDSRTQEKRIYRNSEVLISTVGSDLNFGELLSSHSMKSGEISKQSSDRTQADESVVADRTEEKVLYSQNGNPKEETICTTNKIPDFDQRLTEKKDDSKRLGKNDIPIKTLELRQYQLEQAEKPISGKNCIIVSPTGSGKTYVAIRIIQHHLEERGKIKKVVFIVDKNNLANQQSEKIRDHVECRLKVISGDTQRDEDLQEIKPFLPQYDVFVVTAQMLVNALTKSDVKIVSFSMLIFDECHHCYGSHPFQQIMNHYIDAKQELSKEEEYQLPQVVGFTASIGVGKAKTVEKATEHVQAIMSNMDAEYLVTVQRNKAELGRHVNSPEQFIKEVPMRKRDEFGDRVKALMTATEMYLEDTNVEIVDRNAVKPPSSKGNEQYTQWLEDIVLKALAKLTKSDATRSLYTIRKYLEKYNKGLIHHSYARATDALDCIKSGIEELAKDKLELEKKVKALFEEEYVALEECARDRERTSENPLLLKLKDIIITRYAEEPNMRGIVFVRTRILANMLVSWMDNTMELQRIKARKYTGSQAHSIDGGMTKHEQINAIELFKDGHFKIIVATTIAEEGLDIKECNLVVRYDYAGNPISMVQARGRGRAENSHFYVLASAEKCVAERERNNTFKETMMEEAMKKVQQKIVDDHNAFLAQQCKLQNLSKRERDAAKRNKGGIVTQHGQYALRCLKCSTFLCMSSELRKLLNAHHACISEDIKSSIICKKFSKPGYPGDDIEMGVGQFDCKDCNVKLGTIALYKDVYFPILSITSLKIEDDEEKCVTLKKWKFVVKYFHVPELTTEDLENIGKFGRLVEF